MDKTIFKKCPKHGETEFVYSPTEKHYRCKKCREQAVSDKRKRNKLKLIEYKGGKCEMCGYDKCVDALEFHHLNAENKEFGISNSNIHSFEKLKKEADKCMLLCANCHREIHYKERLVQENKREEDIRNNLRDFIKQNPHTKHCYINDIKLKEVDWDEIQYRIENGVTKREICVELGVTYRVFQRRYKKYLETK